MKIKIERALNGELDKYVKTLNKYNATYHEDDWGLYALIELNDVSEIFTISEELNKNLMVISHRKEPRIRIYDDYME
ncbi:hypothetical protein ABEY43_06695 [Priestia megaterium]